MIDNGAPAVEALKGIVGMYCRKRRAIAQLTMILTCLLSIAAHGGHAATYYVSPAGGAKLSTVNGSPGALNFALAGTGNGIGAAQSGDVVVLENGTYDAAPHGLTVYNSNVTFRAKTWHGAFVVNTSGSALIGGSKGNPSGDIWQGVEFGPSTGLGWSGGGGPHWQFLDCVFKQTGGVGAQSASLFERDLFTDAYSNAFDIGGGPDNLNTGVVFKDCIVRRSNRVSGDDDSVGNKDDFTRRIVYDDLISYDNNGASLWFDTDNNDWTIKNCTFFANHGGADWYYCPVTKGISNTQFTGTGQDIENLAVGQPIKCLSGTAANVGSVSVVTAVFGYNPQTITISPALPAVPTQNDIFAVMQLRASSGDAFITEANDTGTFTNNVVYSNTDHGFFDHSSGGKTYGETGGLTITNNLFAYNGQSFFVWTDQRDTGPALVEHNQFRFASGSSSPFDSWGSTSKGYPAAGGITFDYNDYDADNSKGDWVAWFGSYPAYKAGGVTAGSQPAGQDYLQNPNTWNQDLHGSAEPVRFWGTAPKTYIWPDGKDTDWSRVYNPNNVFGLTGSIHQVDDTDGAAVNTIDTAIAGHKAGDTVTLPVSAHTPLEEGSCEAYDLNGRWVALTINVAQVTSFAKSVPPYVTCAPRNKTATYKIRVKLTSDSAYEVTATFVKALPSAN